jgi:hypothetical protein
MLKFSEDKYVIYQDIIAFLHSKYFKIIGIITGLIAIAILLSTLKGLIFDRGREAEELDRLERDLRSAEMSLQDLKLKEGKKFISMKEFPIVIKQLEDRYGLVVNSKKMDSKTVDLNGVKFTVYTIEGIYKYSDYFKFLDFLNTLQEGWYNLKEVERVGDFIKVRYEVYTYNQVK